MSRYYIFPECADPLRLSKRLVSGLVAGTDTMPQYAGTKQRVLWARLENEGGKPVRIIQTQGSFWEFDGEGGINEGLQKALLLGMESAHAMEPNPAAKVVSLHPRTSRARYEREFRWEPSQTDIERVIADIWPKKRVDRLKSAEGTSQRRPPLSFDAKHAINEISQQFWKIEDLIERLKEPSLKGFAFEARERSVREPEYRHLYLALAEMSEWQLEVDRRHRVGDGIWFAIVDVTLWSDHVGEGLEKHFEQCQGRDIAVAVAQRLLAQHSTKFRSDTTVEAEVITDLEWQKRGYSE